MKLTFTYIISVLVFLGISCNGYTQQLIWAKTTGAAAVDWGKDIAVDAAGSSYTTGVFRTTVDFDPNAGTFNMTSFNFNSDIFIQKLKSNGDFAWSKSIGGSSNDEGLAITTDKFNNVYITGTFLGTVDFNPGAGINNLTSNGAEDIFILKLDTAGNFKWAKSIGAGLKDVGNGIVTDDNGNVYVTGGFQQTVDFDPNAGVVNLPYSFDEDIFVLKLDSNGNFKWAHSSGGVGKDVGEDISYHDGNIYLSGFFSGTADFNTAGAPLNFTSNGNTDAFIQKSDTLGNLNWTKSVGGVGRESGRSITTDIFGNVSITGTFLSTVDFDPNGTVSNLTSNGDKDVFVLQLTETGNYVWAKNLGGSLADFGYAIASDNIGDIYVSGEFRSTADFNPGPLVDNLVSSGGADIFLTKLRGSTGDYKCSTSMGNVADDQGSGLATHDVFVYTTGEFQSTVDFDPGVGNLNLSSNGIYDSYVQKLTMPCSVLPIEDVYFSAVLNQYNLVQLNWRVTSESINKRYIIEKSIDRKTWNKVIEKAEKVRTVDNQVYAGVDNNPYHGKSYYRLKIMEENDDIFYSEIITINIESIIKTSIQLYPNPANNRISMISNTNLDLAKVYVFTSTGKNVTSLIEFNQPLETKVMLNLDQLSKGFYIIKAGSSVSRFHKL